MIIQTGKCFSTANDKADLIHCRQLLSADTSYVTKRIDEDTNNIMNAPNKRSNKSSIVGSTRSIAWAPLLEGKAPFGKTSRKFIPPHRMELKERGVESLEKPKMLVHGN